MSAIEIGKAFLSDSWWWIIPLILGKFFFDLYYSRKKTIKEQKKVIKDWSTLEILANKEILQTPKSMEQVLMGLTAISKGRLSLEVVLHDKTIRFLLHFPTTYRKMIEAQFYAQYPDITIKEIDDYFTYLPAVVPDKYFDLWGAEINLSRNNALPIKTYFNFEAPKEEKMIDTLANLVEVSATLHSEERLILQIIVRPLDKSEKETWTAESKKMIKKVLGEEEPPKITTQEWIQAFFRNLVVALAIPPVWPSRKEKSGSPALSVSLTGRDIAKKIEQKRSQPVFKTTIRAMYIAPRSIYDETSIISLLVYFNQFNTENLNAFSVDDKVLTVKSRFFRDRKTNLRKIEFYKEAKNRAESNPFILSAEELATIYHLPSRKVKGPTLSRSLSKTSEPPADLPVG